jgi:hypothetical protein
MRLPRQERPGLRFILGFHYHDGRRDMVRAKVAFLWEHIHALFPTALCGRLRCGLAPQPGTFCHRDFFLERWHVPRPPVRASGARQAGRRPVRPGRWSGTIFARSRSAVWITERWSLPHVFFRRSSLNSGRAQARPVSLSLAWGPAARGKGARHAGDSGRASRDTKR